MIAPAVATAQHDREFDQLEHNFRMTQVDDNTSESKSPEDNYCSRNSIPPVLLQVGGSRILPIFHLRL